MGGGHYDVMLQLALFIAAQWMAGRCFRRVGAHLHIDVYLTLEEALLGWARDLEHLDGEILSFSHSDLHKQLQDAGKLGAGLDQGDPIVTPMGAALRWRAKGLPQGSNRSGRGDQHLPENG